AGTLSHRRAAPLTTRMPSPLPSPPLHGFIYDRHYHLDGSRHSVSPQSNPTIVAPGSSARPMSPPRYDHLYPSPPSSPSRDDVTATTSGLLLPNSQPACALDQLAALASAVAPIATSAPAATDPNAACSRKAVPADTDRSEHKGPGALASPALTSPSPSIASISALLNSPCTESEATAQEPQRAGLLDTDACPKQGQHATSPPTTSSSEAGKRATKVTMSSRYRNQELKPFSCDVCGHRFGRLEHVRRHQLVHTKERPYSCSVCDKRFARSDNMLQHVRAHERRKAKLAARSSSASSEAVAMAS
ncbi:hypothetical protein EV182_006111, partial [Spiromyces aspiralis]